MNVPQLAEYLDRYGQRVCAVAPCPAEHVADIDFPICRSVSLTTKNVPQWDEYLDSHGQHVCAVAPCPYC